MKEKTVEQRVNEWKKNIVDELAHWKEINENGCNDPFWADGCNMNITRNHIIGYKRELAKICEENGLTLPSEYYRPLPPEVDNRYMANLNQKERVERLTEMGRRKITTKKKKYDEQQLSLF